MQIVLLSGNVSSGKTTLANSLSSAFGFQLLKTKEILQSLAKKKIGRALESERSAMQKFGERLDRETNGKWVLAALTRLMRTLPNGAAGVIVDAVRIKEQIDAVRKAHGFSVTHIHIKAPAGILADRYKHRKTTGIRELATYRQVERDPTESNVQRLENVADVVIDTDRCTEADVLIRAATHLGLYCREYNRTVDVLSRRAIRKRRERPRRLVPSQGIRCYGQSRWTECRAQGFSGA